LNTEAMHIDALEIVGEITEIETIASGSGIRILSLLPGVWRFECGSRPPDGD